MGNPRALDKPFACKHLEARGDYRMAYPSCLMKRAAFWLVLIVSVFLVMEGISTAGWFVLARSREISRPIQLSDIQKRTLRRFARDLACFRPASYAKFEESYPGADEVLEPIRIVEDGSTCVPLQEITMVMRTQGRSAGPAG